MVVNGIHDSPASRSATKVAGGDGVVRVGPLAKFPVVCDLVVDRSSSARPQERGPGWRGGQGSWGRLVPTRGGAVPPVRVPPGGLPQLCRRRALRGCARGRQLNEHAVQGRRWPPRQGDVGKCIRGFGFFATCSKNGACERVCPVGLPIMTITSEANRVSNWRFALLGTDGAEPSEAHAEGERSSCSGRASSAATAKR